LKLIAHSKTDKGLVRSENEDHFCIEGSLGFLAVADGLGGRAAGKIASQMGIDTLRDYLKNEKESTTNRMVEGIRLANQAIYDASSSNPEWNGMGTTIAAVLLDENRLSIAHVGDSRVYLIRSGNIEQLTDDHTFVFEQVKRGFLTREEAEESGMKHILSRALGTAPDVDVDLDELTVSEDDKFVLCSDGLSSLVSDDEILSAVMSSTAPGTACEQLVTMANQKGGYDNITVIVAFLYKEGWLHRLLRFLYHFSLLKNEFQKPKKLKESP
jgi:serine/threonine protein phosphatase PrpC